MIADIYELSPIQAGMLFHRVFAPESTAYFDQFSCRLTGPVDAERLRHAWQAMVDRHPPSGAGAGAAVQRVHQVAAAAGSGGARALLARNSAGVRCADGDAGGGSQWTIDRARAPRRVPRTAAPGRADVGAARACGS